MRKSRNSKQFANLKLELFLLILLVLCIPIFFTLSKMGYFTKSPTVEITSTVMDEDAETLTFVADYDFAPYSFYDKDGNPSGLDIELANEIANRLGKKANIVLGDWPTCKSMIKNGEADILLGLEIFADESKTSTLKTIPVSHDEIKIYGKDEISSAGSLYGKRVGVSSGSIITHLFQLHCTYVEYNTYTDILHAIESGEVDYGICHAAVASDIIDRDNLGLVSSITLMQSFPALGIRENAPDLEVTMETVIKKMSDDGMIDHLYNKWISMNTSNRSLRKTFENNMIFYIAYLIAAVAAMFAAGYNLSILRQRENNLKTALSYQKVLEEEKKRAESASKAKSTFLFNMSHDIRTPMNAVIGFNEIARKNINNPEKALDALNKADIANHHMLGIINDVLEMARIENGTVELSSDVIDVEEHMQAVRTLFLNSMEEKNIQFETNFQHQTETVIGDSTRIMQIIINLIGNAMKFTEKGGRIQVDYKETNTDPENSLAYFEFRVKDNGIGMSDEFKQKIFCAFKREKSSTVSGVQGTGLGLAISKNLAELMGGTLTFSSTLGVGSEFIFTFRLPISAEKKLKTSEDPISLTTLSGKRILLVEDNDLNREIAQTILSDAGMLVEEAADGTEAVRMVSVASPGYYDLVLMDVQMPIMDGYTATGKIRALPDPALANIPIVAMTANAFEEDRKCALEAGMNEHIAKPIDITKMMHVISRLLH